MSKPFIYWWHMGFRKFLFIQDCSFFFFFGFIIVGAWLPLKSVPLYASWPSPLLLVWEYHISLLLSFVLWLCWGYFHLLNTGTFRLLFLTSFHTYFGLKSWVFDQNAELSSYCIIFSGKAIIMRYWWWFLFCCLSSIVICSSLLHWKTIWTPRWL